MKETRLFYCPSLPHPLTIGTETSLSEEESSHAIRVLRLGVNDKITITDGRGIVAQAVITATTKRECFVRICDFYEASPLWEGEIHIAVAPTKNTSRMEWFVEKAVEIGVDCISFLNCDYSERKEIRLDKLFRNAISAMKQSHKARVPLLEGPIRFKDFIHAAEDTPYKYICHCYDMQGEELGEERGLTYQTSSSKPLLLDELKSKGGRALVLIGPEGDFSKEEVQLAVENGFQSVSLGESRLRTETAALAAIHMMYLKKRLPQ